MDNMATNSAILIANNFISKLFNLLKESTSQTVLSAFLGGFFAALFSTKFESRRRTKELRQDKYFEHKNTIVQIEHELIPVRVNMSRNIASINDALDNTGDKNIRIILRFYNISISPGLSLRLLNLDLINQYSEVYSMIESLNSDFQYMSNVVSQVIDDHKQGKIDFSKISVYVSMLDYLKYQCDIVDKKILKLLSISRIAINEKVELASYLKDGKHIQYCFNKKDIDIESNKIIEEEKQDTKDGIVRPKFFALYLDYKKSQSLEL